MLSIEHMAGRVAGDRWAESSITSSSSTRIPRLAYCVVTLALLGRQQLMLRFLAFELNVADHANNGCLLRNESILNRFDHTLGQEMLRSLIDV